MDPWLEEPGGWLDVHNRFIPYLGDLLDEVLPKHYFARVTERVLVEAPGDRSRGIYPDLALVRGAVRPKRTRGGGGDAAVVVEIPVLEYVETSLEIRDRRGMKVVTVIELLSHSNKTQGGPGREQYLARQAEVLASDANLIEIDLLRAGHWTVACPEAIARAAGEFEYLVCVNRCDSRTRFELYPVRLDRRLPRIRVPLGPKDPPVVVALQPVLSRCYDRGRYRDTIDYAAPPVPPLPETWARWTRTRLGRKR